MGFRLIMIICILFLGVSCMAWMKKKKRMRKSPLHKFKETLSTRKLDGSGFSSDAVNKILKEVDDAIVSPDLKKMWKNCFPNTLQTTVEYNGNEENPDTFVITGDIDAMWLRDSTNQVLPYFPFAKEDPKLKAMLKGVLKRQIKSIGIDTYANAFNKNEKYSPWQSDLSTKLDIL